MRRTSRVILVVAVAGLVLMPSSAGAAGVDNGGCPPERSNWTLETSAEDAYQDELAETLAAGFTIQDILDSLGLATEEDLRAFYMEFWDSIDKNGDGRPVRSTSSASRRSTPGTPTSSTTFCRIEAETASDRRGKGTPYLRTVLVGMLRAADKLG